MDLLDSNEFEHKLDKVLERLQILDGRVGKIERVSDVKDSNVGSTGHSGQDGHRSSGSQLRGASYGQYRSSDYGNGRSWSQGLSHGSYQPGADYYGQSKGLSYSGYQSGGDNYGQSRGNLHWGRYRPSRRYCFKCGDPSHLSYNCPLVYAHSMRWHNYNVLRHSLSASVSDVMMKLVGRANECQAVIEGIGCCSLIDTGSMISTLAQSFYERHLSYLKLHSLDGLIDIKVAGGYSLPYFGYVEANIAFPDMKHSFGDSVDSLVIVVPDTEYNRTVPLLIGTNLIGFRYRQRQGSSSYLDRAWYNAFQSLTWRYRINSPIHCLQIQVVPKVYPSKQLVVPGNTRVIVSAIPNVSFVESKTMVVSEFPDKPLPGGIIVASSVAHVGLRRCNVLVELENVSNKAITIPSDVPLCMLQEAVEVSSVGSMSAEQQEMEQFLSMFDFSGLSEHLSAEEISRFNDLLLKWKQVFSVGEWDLGRTNLISHRINMTDENPIKQRHRRIPPAMYDEVRQHLQDMLKAGVIRESYSPWSSPLVLVRKKDNSLRLCVDFRQVNQKTVRDSYYLPRIEESMNALAGAKYFTVLDLKSGFWQVEVAEEHKERTAFTVGPLGLFECNTMPFGVTNGPATFQRLMEKAMGTLQPDKCLVYLDDIILHSSTVSEGLERLDLVFGRLANAGLKLKPSKCQFFKKRVLYLGHIVSEAGVEVDPEKTAALKHWPVPKNVTEVRRFIGFAGFYRRYIKDFSRIVKPLHDLLAGNEAPRSKRRKNNRSKQKLKVSWKWGDEQQVAFDTVRDLLTRAPILGYADYRLPFEVHTDASAEGLGAILYQVQDGVQRVIAYASRGLKPAERRYPAHKLEFLALKWSITEKFHEYLYGVPFEVKTDNNPLTYVLSSARLDAAGHRWLASLASYNFSISYKAGKHNIDADALSRIRWQVEEEPSEKNIPTEVVEAVCQSQLLRLPLVEALCLGQVVDVDVTNTEFTRRVDVGKAQNSDRILSRVMEFVRRGRKPQYLGRSLGMEMRILLNNFHALKIVDDILYRVIKVDGESVFQIVLPASHREEVLRILHDDMGHVGRDRTLDLVRSRFYWPGITRDIQLKVASCERCLRRKAGIPLPRAPLVSIHTSQPMELVCIDFLSLEPSKGYGNVLIITDHFSRYAQAIPTRNQTAQTTARVLYESFIVHYGIPARIHSDQGRNFESQLLKELCLILGVEKTRTTPFHPQSNGMCERFNRSLLNMLGTLLPERKSSWKDHISTVVHAYNCTRHDSTGYTPFELMYGRQPRLPVDVLYNIPPSQGRSESYAKYIQDLRSSLGRAFQLASKESKVMAEKQKDYYDLKVRGAVLHPGDVVLVRKTGINVWDKLADRWEEPPYTVLKKLCDDIPVYVVQPLQGGRKRTLHRNLLLPIRSKKVDSDVADSRSDVQGRSQDVANESESDEEGVAISAAPSDNVASATDHSALHQLGAYASDGDETGNVSVNDGTNVGSDVGGDVGGSSDHPNDVGSVGPVGVVGSEVESDSVGPVADGQSDLHPVDANVSRNEQTPSVEDVDTLEEDEAEDDQFVDSLDHFDSGQEQDQAVGEVPSPHSTVPQGGAEVAVNLDPSDSGAVTRRSGRQKHAPKKYSDKQWQMHAQVVAPHWKGEYVKSLISSCPGIVTQPEVIRSILDFVSKN